MAERQRGPDFRQAIFSCGVGRSLIAQMQKQCESTEKAIAHLKILFATADGSNRIAVTSSSTQATWDGEDQLGLVREASAIINARIATDPEALRQMVENALFIAAQEWGVSASVLDLQSFAPSPPTRPVLQSAN